MQTRQYQLQAAYNRTVMTRFYDLAEQLADEVRREDRGSFFGSIHGTFNHLLLTDRLWMGNFTDQPEKFDSLDQELHPTFAELRTAHLAMADRIVDWAADIEQAWLDEPAEFLMYARKELEPVPRWVTLTHFFNHQTHHRGQITAMFSQVGVDYGVTDIPWVQGLLDEVFHRPA